MANGVDEAMDGQVVGEPAAEEAIEAALRSPMRLSPHRSMEDSASAGFQLPCQPEHVEADLGADAEAAQPAEKDVVSAPSSCLHTPSSPLAAGQSSGKGLGGIGSGTARQIRFANAGASLTPPDVQASLAPDSPRQAAMTSFRSGMTPMGTIGLEIRRYSTVEASSPRAPARRPHDNTTSAGDAFSLGINNVVHEASVTATVSTSVQVVAASPKVSVWPSVFGGSNLRGAHSVRLLPGATMKSDYKIAGVIGEGSFGKVQKAIRLSDDLEVAIKSVERSKMESIASDAMQTELAIAKRLRHPHIALIYEIFDDADHVHIVMEFCSGGDLFELLAAGHFFSDKKVARYLWQMVSGIAYCHFNKFCHRDLKPENYLVECKRADADLKLIDFGLAKVFKKGEPMHSCVGSVLYMAPEVFKGKGYDEKRDIWSIGIIGHMMCTRRVPFESETEDAAIEEIRDGMLDVRWLDARLIGAHPLKRLIWQLLQVNPVDRPSAKTLTRNSWFREQALEAPTRRCCGFKLEF